MTSAHSVFGPSRKFDRTRANWLGRYLEVEHSFDKKLRKTLLQAYRDTNKTLETLVNDNLSTEVSRLQISLTRKELRRQLNETFNTTGYLIRDSREDAALAAVEANLYDESSVLTKLFPDPIARVQYADSLRQTARRNIESTVTRVLFSERPLAESVYRTKALASGRVSRVINSALARGSSAKQLAKDVAALINPDVPGGVSYAAMRLGRTEINNAFHAQAINDAQDQPWVSQMRWHLSKRHEDDPGDECESYAEIGLFNKNDVPVKPHPNCRCYVTPEVDSDDEFEKRLITGQYDDYIRSVMAKGRAEYAARHR
ncbi:head maturation protease [Mycobacterium phage Cuke]|uniref:Capsid maturation protease n=1 Tax=Mycobacterium phage Cuke TaxID=2079417 RepID=A0A2L1IWR9_9CAUD|nr:head maturation protease [Mycobacterium phage Cuke]AVD99624.1 hypothetical protein SEA_CUKE_6 [Mycobacterium phage Cuke]